MVSFHFGLPTVGLVGRVKATGATVMSSATSVAEARWLVDHGCDLVIAQGLEAGGHVGHSSARTSGGRSAPSRWCPRCRRRRRPGDAAGGIATRGESWPPWRWAPTASSRVRVPAHARGDHRAATPAGAGGRRRRQHRHHECLVRPPGQEHRQPGGRRAGSVVGPGAAVRCRPG